MLEVPAPVLGRTGIHALLEAQWGMAGADLAPLPSERDLNVRVDGRFVLKVSNPAEPLEGLEMEVGALAHARRADPELGLPSTVRSRSGRSLESVVDDHGRPCAARLMTLLAGAPLQGRPLDRATAQEVGALSARVSLALQGYFHPAAGRAVYWDIRRLPALLQSVPEAGADGFTELADRVAPALQATERLPSWLQHADLTLTNALAADGRVTGAIDFGDMHHTAAVCDLAVTLASVLRNSDEPRTATIWELADAVLQGYQRHRLLLPAEVDVLGELVLARLVLTLAVSAIRAPQHADNTTYITQYDRASRPVLDELAALDPAALAARLARLAGTARAPRPGSGRDADRGLLNRRRAAMGGGLAPLFYQRPLHIVRGEGPWLFGDDGARYLDAYNNVAVVGHAHPAVTQAVGRQLAAVNTHSRYLHPSVVELAERLLATMPPELDTCLFTTSGTEANELAWRLATTYTGGRAAAVVQRAYHGASKWMADLSSNEWPPGHHPEHVVTFPAPRGDVGADPARARIRAVAAEAAATGNRLALVLVDPQFTSEGILDPSADFMNCLVTATHECGALFLADEVQSGFGRSGPLLWRFRVWGRTPDIVTLGKPMGAGYPLGAVITRREIADRLARDYEYFSTFAATPVAAAAGLAVLDLLQATDLPRDAVRVGEHLRHRLGDLAATPSGLGQVRGTGLLAGVDLLAPPGTDARAFARDVVDRLVGHRVLAGLTGPQNAVLKVRPPLVWTREHADRFVDTLAHVLAEPACGQCTIAE